MSSSMREYTGRRRGGPIVLGLVLLFVFAGGLALHPASAGPSAASARINRQIGVMEKILDKLLLDSPNFLVGGGDCTNGLYIDGFGALFVFETSLTDGKEFFTQYLKELDRGFEVTTDKDGDKVIVIKKGKAGKGAAGDSLKHEALKEESDDERPSRTYEAGKSELMQALLDYGETMSALPDGESLQLAAFLGGTSYFREKKISRLVIRVGMSDLRAFGAGKMSESELRSRMSVEEY
jgi:hypothetical protein